MKKVFGLLCILCATLTQTYAQQKNIIFIIADDHRYDAMGFMKKIPWLETPTRRTTPSNASIIRSSSEPIPIALRL